MKIGIITMHCSTNIGASLQAHALYKKIEELGHQPEIIDYRPELFTDLLDSRKKWHWKGIKNWLKGVLLYKRLSTKHNNQIDFEQNFYPTKTLRYNSKQELQNSPPVYDCYICGSDQIWNPAHINYDSTYFLGFVPKECKKIFSYAASIGEDSLTQSDLDFLAQETARFSAISVREDSAVKILENCNRKAVQNIDPTLMFPAEYWLKQAQKPQKAVPEKFIFYYPLQHNPIEVELISKLKKETNLKCVSTEAALFPVKGTDIQLPACSPAEFLWLVANAEYVITNSFHGLVFSLIFNKKIISFKNEYRNCRLDSLCRLFNIEGLQISSLEDLSLESLQRYWELIGQAETILANERIKSESYLMEAFK